MKNIKQTIHFLGVVIFFICGPMMVQSAFSQTDIVSQVNQSVAISVNNRSFILTPGATVRSNLLPPSGEREITISWTDAGKNYRLRRIINIDNGRFILTEAILSDKDRQAESGEISSTPIFAPTVRLAPVSAYSTNLVIENKSSHRFLIREGKFAGLALKPGQLSDSLNIPLGLTEFILLIDLDQDALSTGRNYIQQVVTGIVVKSQKSFLVTDRHLHITFSGGKTTFIFFNQTDYEVVGVGSAALGKVIGAKRRTRKKIVANEGFLSTAWQYIDEQGNKRQAISEFVVFKGKTRVYIKELDLIIYRAQ